jgi:hypothetical protein
MSALAAARSAARLHEGQPEDLYRVAVALAGCLPQAKRVDAEQFAEVALALLSEAIDDGFQDIKKLTSDPELAPLRSRSQFRKWMQHFEQSGRAAPMPAFRH